jgi:hypothetical protein
LDLALANGYENERLRSAVANMIAHAVGCRQVGILGLTLYDISEQPALLANAKSGIRKFSGFESAVQFFGQAGHSQIRGRKPRPAHVKLTGYIVYDQINRAVAVRIDVHFRHLPL